MPEATQRLRRAAHRVLHQAADRVLPRRQLQHRTGGFRGAYGVHAGRRRFSRVLAGGGQRPVDADAAIRFPGLKPGDCWCLCAERWKEAFDAGKAPKVRLDRDARGDPRDRAAGRAEEIRDRPELILRFRSLENYRHRGSVGWVEQRETHHNERRQWVSLSSTHPTEGVTRFAPARPPLHTAFCGHILPISGSSSVRLGNDLYDL